MKKIVFVFSFMFIAYHNYAQSVFTYNIKKDIALGGVALGVFASPFFFHNVPESVPRSLDRNDVNVFDRNLMYSYNKTLDLVSEYGAYGLLALPVLSLAGNIKDGNALLTYSIMYGEAVLLTSGTVNILKSAVIRYRPYMYSGDIPAGNEQDYYNSFPSGSTSIAFLSAGFLSATFSKEYPDSPWKLPVIGTGYALAAAVGVARIAAGAHFTSDVLTGAAIGSLYGYLIPYLHLNNRRKNSDITFYPIHNGLMLSFRF